MIFVEKNTSGFREIDVSTNPLPIKCQTTSTPFLTKLEGKKPRSCNSHWHKASFYKQAPLVFEAVKEKLPVIVVDTGQHFDEVLRFGIEEFNLQKFVGYASRYVET